MKIIDKILTAGLFVAIAGCAELDIINENNGDTGRVLANSNEYDNVVNSQFSLNWQATQWYEVAMPMNTMADAMTSSWGNFGMRDLSSEPRTAIVNSPTYVYSTVIEDSWEFNYSVIGAVNDVLRIYNDDPEVRTFDDDGNDITYQVIAKAKYLLGTSYGNIGLRYDKAKFVNETVPLAAVPDLAYSDYNSLIDNAVSELEAAITAANSGDDFSIGAWNGITVTRDQFVKLCRTLQAKYLAYRSRSDAENETNDWASILTYANAGVDFDFAPLGDGNIWWDGQKYYGTETGWARVDYRIISWMDPNQPSRFPTDGSHPLAPATSADDRLTTDMSYSTAIPFRADRGLYHFSHYDYTRYDYHYPGATGPMPHTTKAENDLLRAEALIRTGGSKATAAALINNSRVDRGGLSALTGAESDDQLLEYVFYERFVELYATMGGLPFYDRRRLPDDDGSFAPYSGLQPGTPKQFPIPAKELQLLNIPIYTFGGLDE
jgi:hypothetical protein